MGQVEDFMKAAVPGQIERFLIPWLKVQSVTENEEACRQAAEMLKVELQGIEFESRLIELDSKNPLVYADMDAGADITVLLYGHYDVGPITHPEQWVIDDVMIDGFDPRIHNDAIVGRGNSKAQAFMHIMAFRYFQQFGWPANVKLLIEGNGEGEDPNIDDWVKENRDLLNADLVMISDSGLLRPGVPAIIERSRGFYAATLTTKIPHDLVKIIHQSHSLKDSKTTIDGFDKDAKIVKATKAVIATPPEPRMGIIRPEKGCSQLAARWYRPSNDPLGIIYANLNITNGGYTVKITSCGPKEGLDSGSYGGPTQNAGMNLMHLLGFLSTTLGDYEIDYIKYGDGTTKLAKEAYAQVTFKGDVKGMLTAFMMRQQSAYPFLKFDMVAVENRTAFVAEWNPDATEPTALLSYRLALGQNPKAIGDLLSSFAHNIAPSAVIRDNRSNMPYVLDPGNPFLKAVQEGLMQGYNTREVDMVGKGGSIPNAILLSKILNAPCILWGISYPDDNLEKVEIDGGIMPGARSSVYIYTNASLVNLS